MTAPRTAPRGDAPVNVPAEIRSVMGADPTAEQWRAISMPLEPYVVVAGAGSGKTSVIAARVVYLALVAQGRLDAEHEGLLPGNVLCLTFTNKATEHLMLMIRSALASLDLPEGEEPTILNYHGFAAQILERHGLLAGIERDQRVLTQAQRIELCARVLDQMSFEHLNAEWQPTVIDKILNLADQAANHRREPDEIIEFVTSRLDQLSAYRSEKAYAAALERIELAHAVKRFQELKRQLRVIDFGDQITLALSVVERFPEVAAQYRSRFLTLILDEYQDTNVAQANLIQGVFGDGFPVTAVGDPDQSIYGWRGASLFNLLEFRSQFPKANGEPAERLPLYTNFRSGSRILAAADRVIEPIPAAQRPDPEKRLEPWPRNGAGAVQLVRLLDEWREACWIADRILELHSADSNENPWSSFAVLCRKSRLFTPLQEAFAERKIPVEIVGLAGLVKVPEVVEVLAYARAVADPKASVSLARILLGPRYRVGFKDLARVAAWAKDKNYALRGEDRDEPAPFLFAEALEHLDEVSGLSDEGRQRLEEFRSELAALRQEAGRPVGEFLAEIIRRVGLLAELDASLDFQVALATKRNLAAFLDEVHAFSPLEGQLTLRAFLDYVQAVEEADRPEWSPVQPSAEDSVKVMTVHQAKGLEFDNVFVPGLAKDLLPDMTVQQNPAERGYSLDFDLRGDAAILPRMDDFKNNLTAFWRALRDQEVIEERRTCYVALTRARKRLLATAAHWYGEGLRPKESGVFFDELAEWGEQTGLANVDRGPDVSDENPLVGYRERFVRDWPGPALRDDADAVFPAGWRRTALDVASNRSLLDNLVQTMTPEQRSEYETEAKQNTLLGEHLLEREREPPAGREPPTTVSVAGVIEYARCPKRFYWSAVRPLPRFSGPAARLGTQLHAWIERKSSGQTSLLELDEAPDLTAEELAGSPGKLERLQKVFNDSRFSTAPPLYAERPFLLYLEGFVVNGRIDAIFGAPNGPWEVVDYKTGSPPAAEDPLAGLQLDLYALACTEVWGKTPEDVRLTYFYLSTGEEVTRLAGDPAETRDRVVNVLRGMADRQFGPTPGSQCHWCDFLSFCDAGKAYVGPAQVR
ncbi:MAG TPA: ATP-dependent DNA helicase [Actinomycetota bacterium]|nr:ATP-dependent DNA helicase [Actinomycetota bacterium]